MIWIFLKYDLGVIFSLLKVWATHHPDNRANYRIDASVLAPAPFIENTNKTGQIRMGHLNCKRWHPSQKAQTKSNKAPLRPNWNSKRYHTSMVIVSKVPFGLNNIFWLTGWLIMCKNNPKQLIQSKSFRTVHFRFKSVS